MTPEIIIVFIVILIGLTLFMTEWISVDATSILVMALLIVSGVLTAEEGLSGFASAATATVAAMFVLSTGLFKTGALGSVSNWLIRTGQKSYLLCLLSIALLAGCLSAFINDTAVVALFIPVVIGVARTSGIPPSKLLMPLSFGALFGGCCTLIGTSTNILVSSIAVRQGEPALRMFEFAPFGLAVLLTGTLYMVFIGARIIPARKVEEDLEEKYAMRQYLTQLVLLSGSRSVNLEIQDTPLVRNLDVDIISITRGGINIPATPSKRLMAGDVLHVRCNIETLSKLKVSEGIELKSESKFQVAEPSETLLIEAVVTPDSNFEGRAIRNLNFPARYNANILAVRHRDEILHERLGAVKIKPGDGLLISILKDNLQELRQSPDLLVVSHFEVAEYRRDKIFIAFAIIVAVVLSAAIGILHIAVAAIVGSLLMVGTGCLKPQEAYDAIQWKVVFLLAGVLSLGVALEKTGAADILAGFMIDSVGQFGNRTLLGAFFLITLLFTNFMSNNASAALLAPIAIVAGHALDVSPKPFLMAVTYAASLSLMTPVGYQTNAMIYAPGNYRFSDYFKVGAPLDLIFLILAIWLIPLIFPF